MPISPTELLKNYPPWAEKVFNDPIVTSQLSVYNSYVYIGIGNDKKIWKTREPYNWCNENVGKRGEDWTYLALNVWLFKKEEDAVYFKLTWM